MTKVMIINRLNETDDIMIKEGLMLNVSEYLINELNENLDCYIAVSSDESFYIIYGTNIENFKQGLIARPELTSWEVATG